ncbi:ThiF family adenylyltransferase [Mycolicibacterium vulneris]
MLIRAGVGHLTLADGDFLKPGNLVRHLADEGTIGLPKPLAVKAKLVKTLSVEPRQIHTSGKVVTAAEAVTMLDQHDLSSPRFSPAASDRQRRSQLASGTIHR